MKRYQRLAATAALLGILVPGAGFAAGQQDLIKPVTKPLTFVWIPKLVHPWYEEVQNGAEYAVQELKQRGITIKIDWNAPPEANVVDQNRRIETAISTKPDGLAVSCLDPATNNELLREAMKAGVNLITFDTFCSPQFPFVGHRADEDDGLRLGELVAKKLGGKGEIGILSGSLTAPNHVARVKGFKEALAKYPGMKIVFEQPDNDNLQRAVTLSENALQAHPDIQAIFAANASAPVGAARTVTNAGKAGKVLIVGFDELPETQKFMDSGAIYATIVQRQWEQGYWGVYYLLGLNENHTIPIDHETGSRILLSKKTM
jgi:ribose transport system substrate-binding protein